MSSGEASIGEIVFRTSASQKEPLVNGLAENLQLVPIPPSIFIQSQQSTFPGTEDVFVLPKLLSRSSSPCRNEADGFEEKDSANRILKALILLQI